MHTDSGFEASSFWIACFLREIHTSALCARASSKAFLILWALAEL